MADLTPEQKLALIRENLQEIIDVEIIEEVLKTRDLKVYFVAQLLAAQCHVKILLADIHGFLDNLKAPIELVNFRADYYQFAITSMLKAVGVSIDKLEFIKGSSYQKGPEYAMDVYKLCSVVSEHDAKKAGAEVVKQTGNAPLSGLLYPILQVLDEQHLDVDAQFGGNDQRKLFTAAKEWLPRIGYKQRAHLLSPMVPGLQGGKMSASDPNSKIDLLDPPDVVTKKLKKAECVPKVTEGNGVLSFTEYVLLPAGALKYGRPEFRVDRSRDNLPELVYTSIKEMHEDYKNDVLTPQLLKPAVTKALIDLMAPIQAEFQASQAWQEIMPKAYPPEEAKKKEKKVKDKGSRHPGGKKPEAKSESAIAEAGDAPAASSELPIRSS
ncbi:putative tyrosyl-trna synthetase protein [Phaeoacremonium minimum UCRPA7]|uniref:tyrosine--tRNA ligase n=1 Tax=Phaeoacremonium minimum (strain UCR-PA7) TaxID=1286976 RepID=R8BHM2_PHAM7|nr:putative tyrosyl-trna synthetase protein [Phaeoacremonium minimum UCRPA7]EON98767.1 putative tyrosyl-trna synthetase protein [Phaeoacremonium minimum UCRPA7]